MQTIKEKFEVFSRFITFNGLLAAEYFCNEDFDPEVDGESAIRKIITEFGHVDQLAFNYFENGYSNMGDTPYFMGTFDATHPHWKAIMNKLNPICGELCFLEICEETLSVNMYIKQYRDRIEDLRRVKFTHFPKPLCDSVIPFEADLEGNYLIENISGLGEAAGGFLRCPRQIDLKRVARNGSVKFKYIRDDQSAEVDGHPDCDHFFKEA
jgi:hypothetical protein